MRVDPKPKEVKILIEIEALENLGTIPYLLSQLDNGTWQMGQYPLFTLATTYPDENWSLEDKTAAQIRILGTGIIANPLELASDVIESSGIITTLEASSHLE